MTPDAALTRIPCILLAAGASSRMGCSKLLLPVGGEPMVHRSARIALERCRPLIVVTGCAAEAVEAALADLVAVADPENLVIVFNPAWEGGRVTSAAAGIGALPAGCAGFFLHHADMPFVDEAAFDALARAAGERAGAGGAPRARVASRGARPGHPVYFPASYIPAIRALGKGEKIRSVIEELGFLLVESGCDGVLEDMDSPEDYEELLHKYGLAASPPR